MNVPFNALHQVNLDLAEAKNIIRKTVAENKEVFAAYKKAKKQLDDDIAYLRSIQSVQHLFQQEDQAELRRNVIDTKITTINEFDWEKALDCNTSFETPHQLKRLLYGTIVDTMTYNPYTNQRQLQVKISHNTSSVQLLVAKTILQKVKECPIPMTGQIVRPTFTIIRGEQLDTISYFLDQWHIMQSNDCIRTSFKSLDHLLKALREKV